MTIDQIRNDLNGIKNILSNNGIESVVIMSQTKESMYAFYGYDLIRKRNTAVITCGSSMLNYGPAVYKERFNEFKNQFINTILNKEKNKFTNIDPAFINVAITINNKKELLQGRELYIIYDNGRQARTCTYTNEEQEVHGGNNINNYDGRRYPLIIFVSEDMVESIRLRSTDPRRIYEALLMTLIHEMGHQFGQNIRPSDLPVIIKNYNQYIVDKRKSHIIGSKYPMRDIDTVRTMKTSGLDIPINPRKVNEVQADNYAYKNINKFDPSVNRERAGSDLGDVLADLNAFQDDIRNLKNQIVTKIIPLDIAESKIEELNRTLSKLMEGINTKKIPTNLVEKINTLKMSIEALKRYTYKLRLLRGASTNTLKHQGTDIEFHQGGGGNYAAPYYRKKALSGDMYKTKEYKPTQTYDHREYYDKQKNNKSNKKKP